MTAEIIWDFSSRRHAQIKEQELKMIADAIAEALDDPQSNVFEFARSGGPSQDYSRSMFDHLPSDTEPA